MRRDSLSYVRMEQRSRRGDWDGRGDDSWVGAPTSSSAMGEPVADDGASDSADTAAVSSVARDTVVRRRGEASAEARGAARA